MIGLMMAVLCLMAVGFGSAGAEGEITALEAGQAVTENVEEYGTGVLYSFTAEESGWYLFSSEGKYIRYAIGRVYDADKRELGSDQRTDGSENIRVYCHLTAGETVTYSFRITGHGVSSRTQVTTKVVPFTGIHARAVNGKVTATNGEGTALHVYAFTTRDAALSYSWFRMVGEEAIPVPGSAKSLTIPVVTHPGRWICRVSDGTDTEDVPFDVDTLYSFTAEAEDAEIEITEGTENVILRTIASSQQGSLSYQWYETTGGSEVLLANETGAEYSFAVGNEPAPRKFRCRVTNTEAGEFLVTRDVDFRTWYENGFTVPESSVGHYTIYPGASIGGNRNSQYSCRNGGLSFQWYEADENGEHRVLLEGATDPSYTVTEDQDREICFVCRIRDDYGNEAEDLYECDPRRSFGYVSYGHQIMTYPESSQINILYGSNKERITSYQWYEADYDRITDTPVNIRKMEGETLPYLDLTANAAQQKVYFCRMSNDDTAATTELCFVTYRNSPSPFCNISAGENPTVTRGEDATLTMSVESTTGAEIHYDWYRREGPELVREEGTEGGNCTVHNVQKDTTYYCRYTDGTNMSYREFTIHVSAPAELTAAADGEDSFLIQPGDTVTMRIQAAGATGYQWYKQTYMPESVATEARIIPGATGTEYTAENARESADYLCVASNGEDKVTVPFTVRIDTGLQAEAIGPTEKMVIPGGTHTMAVTAATGEGYTLRYQWYVQRPNEERRKIDGATDSSVTDTLTGNRWKITTYWCQVSDEYNVQEVCFAVTANSQITAEPKKNPVEVLWGDPVSVELNVDCKSGTPSYRWYTYVDTISTEAALRLDADTVKGISTSRFYYCDVTDGYTTVKVTVEVRMSTGLKVRAVGGQPNAACWKHVLYGESAEMEVTAESRVGTDNLTYRWEKYARNENGVTEQTVIPGVDGPRLTVENVTEPAEYYCFVSDGYTQDEQIFMVEPESGLELDIMSRREVTVLYGTGTTLKVKASTQMPEAELTYTWYGCPYDNGLANHNWVIIPDEHASELETGEITGHYYYKCEVSDGYTSDSKEFLVWVDSGLTVTSDTAFLIPESTLPVDVTLQASNLAGSDKYSWYWSYNYVRDDRYDATAEQTFRLETKPYSGKYTCEVMDGIGGRRTVEFQIVADNQFTLTQVGYPSRTVNIGDEVRLETAAYSPAEGEIQYQWQHGSTDIEGATGSSYTFTVDSLSAGGTYRCKAVDGNNTYATADFTVQISENLTAQAKGEQNRTLAAGKSDRLAVTAYCGFGTPTFTWFRDTAEIEDEDGSEIRITGSDANTVYKCRVEDRYGSYREFVFRIMSENIPELELGEETEVTLTESNLFTAYRLTPEKTGSHRFLVNQLPANKGMCFRLYKAPDWNYVDMKDVYSTTFSGAFYRTLEQGQGYYLIAEATQSQGPGIGEYSFTAMLDREPTTDIFLRKGQAVELPEFREHGNMLYNVSADSSIVSTDGMKIRANEYGTTTLTVTYRDGYKQTYNTEVIDGRVVYLPNQIQEIKEDAFNGDSSIKFIVIRPADNGVVYIRSRAFANMGRIQVIMPYNNQVVAGDAFEGSEPFFVLTDPGYAEKHSIPYAYWMQGSTPEE